MKKICVISAFIISLLLSGCYTYNIPSGANTPLITEQGESKVSFSANFNEIGGNLTYALTNHALFTMSGNFIESRSEYVQDYDSLFYRKTPNNFELAFGYYGGKYNFVNMFLFGVGTGNNAYSNSSNGYYPEYYQTEYIQYFLQYTAGFKYQKVKGRKTMLKEQGLSLRYGYHDYHVLGIYTDYDYEEIWNEEEQYYDYNEIVESKIIEESNFFNSFSVYYFFRTGNDKIQFEVSPGFSFYDEVPKYKIRNFAISKLHFNVGIVFNLNNIIKE